MNTNPITDLKPGDIFEMEYGDYDNWVTARCLAVNLIPDSYFDVEIVFEYVQNDPTPDEPHVAYARSSDTVKIRKERKGKEGQSNE